MLGDLTYKVVVIDDDADLYEDYVEKIEELLNEQGYLLTHERYEEIQELEYNSLDDVDLFLVDLKFGSDDKGPEFISKIRENYFTDILFYSSASKEIQEYRSKGEFEGVFFAVRDENKKEIYLRIGQLIDKMIKRSNTPIASRGIVLGCVAELDNIIKDKTKQLLEDINEEQMVALRDKCTKMYHESYNGNSDKIMNFFGTEFHQGKLQWNQVKENQNSYNICELIDNIYITDSNKNCRVFLKVYETLNQKNETYNEIKGFLELLNIRNVFAHVKEERQEDGIYKFEFVNSDKCLRLTNQQCNDLRKSIIKYYKSLETMTH